MRAAALVGVLLATACGSDGAGGDAGGEGLDAAPIVRSYDAYAIPPCAPGAADTWIEEGSPLALEVGCTNRALRDDDTFAMPDLPAGATFDPATRTLAWTPGLDQAATLTLAVTVGDEAGTVKVGVLDRHDAPGNVPVDPTTYLEEHGLPVLHVATTPGLNRTDYTPATVTWRGRVIAAHAKYRGQSSFGYPKKSYTLKFDAAAPFDEPAHGFDRRRRLTVTTTFDDVSHVRVRLAFALWNRLDPAHVQVSQMSAIVFVDGVYQGLYALTDHIDRHLFEAQGADEDGNLYKADTHACNFRLTLNNGDAKATPHEGYDKKEGTPLPGEPGAWDDLDALITWADTSDDATFAAELEARMDRRDVEGWWQLVTLIQAADSAGKNSYLWRDDVVDRWRVVPWDFNASFGQTWQSARMAPDVPLDGYVWANGLWARMLADAAIGPAMRADLADALVGPVALPDVLALLDAMAAEVHASALRDEARWGAAVRGYGGWSFRDDFLDHDAEVAYVRAWIEARWAFAAAAP